MKVKMSIQKNKLFMILFFTILFLLLPSFIYSQIRSDFMIDSDTTYSQRKPSVAFDGKGNWHIIWESYYRIKHSILNGDGEVIRYPHYITEDPMLLWKIEIAASANHVVVAYDEGLAVGGKYICGKIISLLDDSTVTSFLVPTIHESPSFEGVTFVNDSTLLILFKDYRVGFYRETFCLQLASTSGNMIGECRVVNDESPSIYYPSGIGRIIFNPEAAQAAVFWEDNSSGRPEVYGRLYSADGTSYNGRFMITDPDNYFNLWAADMDMESTGDFIFVWAAKSDIFWNVYLRRYFTDGTAKSNSIKVNRNHIIGSFPAVDISIDHNDGKFVVAWSENDSANSNIWGQRFSSNGNPIGDNFRISKNTDFSRRLYAFILLVSSRIYTVLMNEPLPGLTGKSFIWGNILDFYNPIGIFNYINRKKNKYLILFQNFPNPFNLQTVITYELPIRTHVILKIYDMVGREVITLIDEDQSSGFHRIIWDGKDRKGGDVTSGIYLAILKTGRSIQTQKLAILR